MAPTNRRIRSARLFRRPRSLSRGVAHASRSRANRSRPPAACGLFATLGFPRSAGIPDSRGCIGKNRSKWPPGDDETPCLSWGFLVGRSRNCDDQRARWQVTRLITSKPSGNHTAPAAFSVAGPPQLVHFCDSVCGLCSQPAAFPPSSATTSMRSKDHSCP